MRRGGSSAWWQLWLSSSGSKYSTPPDDVTNGINMRQPPSKKEANRKRKFGDDLGRISLVHFLFAAYWTNSVEFYHLHLFHRLLCNVIRSAICSAAVGDGWPTDLLLPCLEAAPIRRKVCYAPIIKYSYDVYEAEIWHYLQPLHDPSTDVMHFIAKFQPRVSGQCKSNKYPTG